VGKPIKGRTRHAAADTLGLMVGAVVRPVGVPDRDGAPMAPRLTSKDWPWLRHIFAEGGYAGPKLRGALKDEGDWRIEIIKRQGVTRGFEVLPHRWVIERTFAWRKTGMPPSQAPKRGS
jgi:putative transposase